MSDSRRPRSRSREDRDRSRSSSRRRHRHKKKKHRRHRSRSNSLVHINPLFAAGPSHVDHEIVALRNELYLAQTRATALESDAYRTQHEYGRVREELDRTRLNTSGMDHKLRESQMRTANIENTNTQLRAQVNGQMAELEKLREKVKFFEMEQGVNRERVGELTKRNEKIVKKCEELTVRSRGLQVEKDEAVHNVFIVRQQLDDARQRFESQKQEVSRLQEHLKTSDERWRELTVEKTDLETQLREKDVQISMERRKFAQEKKKDQETIDKLTEKIQSGVKEDVDQQFRVIMGTILKIQEQQDFQLKVMEKILTSGEQRPSDTEQ